MCTYFIINTFFWINILPSQITENGSFLFRDVHLVEHSFSVTYRRHFFSPKSSKYPNYMAGKVWPGSSFLFNDVSRKSAQPWNTTLILPGSQGWVHSMMWEILVAVFSWGCSCLSWKCCCYKIIYESKELSFLTFFLTGATFLKLDFCYFKF